MALACLELTTKYGAVQSIYEYENGLGRLSEHLLGIAFCQHEVD